MVPGIGKRSAQKLMLELRPRFDGAEAMVVASGNMSEVRAALEGLGYEAAEITAAVSGLEAGSAGRRPAASGPATDRGAATMREENLLAGAPLPDEAGLDAGLRPRRLADFVGQDALKERLEILIEAARARAEPIDHVLFSGPPGLGKTSLAGILAAEMDVTLRVTSGPALERPGDLAAVLTNLEPGDVLFVDEIHRLSRPVEEVLYPAMEDFVLDIVVGKGPAARSIRLDLPRFTLVGATTRVGRVASPLRDRFGYVARLDYYPAAELAAIVTRSAQILDVDHRRRRRRGDRQPLPGHPEGRQPAAAPGAGPRHGARRRLHRRPRRRHRPGGVRGRPARPRQGRPVHPGGDRPQVRREGRSGCRRWPSPSARTRRRSRTPTSRSCSWKGCSNAPHAVGWQPPTPTSTSGWTPRQPRPTRRGRCSTSHVRLARLSGLPLLVCRAALRPVPQPLFP